MIAFWPTDFVLGIPLPVPTPKDPTPPPEEDSQEEELDLEAIVEETEKIVEEKLVEEMDQTNLAEQLLMSVQNMVGKCIMKFLYPTTLNVKKKGTKYYHT